jgi:energy-coupling factor transport system ATP-binding protein
MRPALVALDEPTSQLDPEGSEAVLAACLRIARDGRAVVVAEHRLESLLASADRLLQVEGGRVSGTTEAALRRAVVSRTSHSPEPLEAAWEMIGVDAGPAGPRGAALLEGISLAGGAGEVVALVGPNGSGKTTLLRTLAGLLPALMGTVRRPAGRTAYLPQNPGALLHLPSVRAEVELTLRRAGAGPAPDVTASAGAMMAAFGLTHLAGRYPRDLSSGERQRAALAATLVGSPALVLLDEPTRGMDLAARRSLAAAVHSLTERGSAVVIATHDADLATELADRTIELRVGRAIEVEPGATPQTAATPPAAAAAPQAAATPEAPR